MNPGLLCLLAKSILLFLPTAESYLAGPAYVLDDVIRGPVEPYTPQPGDIFLATDQRIWYRIGHTIAGAHGVHHSGLVFMRPDGRLGLIEAGPFDSLIVEVMGPLDHMGQHVAAGDRVWVRRRKVPLTAEQSARLTTFALAQEGKRFDIPRWLGQLTPLRCRGVFRTGYMGHPQGIDRPRWFCSELVTECFVAARIMDADTARPSATYPRDLFYGRSIIPHLDRHLKMDTGWCPPARWLPASVVSTMPLNLRESETTIRAVASPQSH